MITDSKYPMKRNKLILVPEQSNCDINDFHIIAKKIRETSSDIEVHVVKRRHLWWRQLAFIFSPSLYVAFYQAKNFQPLRGTCVHGRSIGKSGQYLQMHTAGFDVIPWQYIVAGEHYEADLWGDMAIVKPDHGREGVDVCLLKPEDIRYEKICVNNRVFLIQKFIDTGDNPNYFRALTLFGETLSLRKTTSHRSMRQDRTSESLPNPVANSSNGTSVLVDDAEVIAFAKEMALKAFPNIPLLGQDIVRERTTGRLYCLEVNPYGSTWHFSTSVGLALQRRDNINYQTQFDAFTLAANILIDKTREMAR